MNTLSDFITVRVKFNSGTSTYDYGAPKDMDIVVGDIVIVSVGSTSYAHHREATVVEVLKSITSKTTRGIVGVKKMCPLTDVFFRDLTKQKNEVLIQVNKILEAQKYAVAAAADAELGRKLKELGLL